MIERRREGGGTYEAWRWRCACGKDGGWRASVKNARMGFTLHQQFAHEGRVHPKSGGTAYQLLREAMHGLRDEASVMGEDEIKDQPTILAHLRLADRIERYLRRRKQ